MPLSSSTLAHHPTPRELAKLACILQHTPFRLTLQLRQSQSLVQQVLFLFDVTCLQTGSNRSARRTSSVPNVLISMLAALAKDGLHPWLNVAPGTSIQGLLLGPDDVLGIGELFEFVAELSPREGVQLLNTGNGDVVDIVRGTVLVEGSVYLSGAYQKALALLRGLDSVSVLRIGNEPLEVGVTGKVLDVGAREGVT